MLVWRHGSTLQPCKCPLCRRHISLLVPSEDTIRDRNDATVKEVLGNLETYNRLFGGRSSSLVQVCVLSLCFKLLVWSFVEKVNVF
jgi:RING finger protein 170